MTQKLLDRADRRLVQREAILDAALEVFASEGFKGAATSEIARRAGVPKSVLYYYFPTKKQLYAEAFEHILEIWDSLFDESSAPHDPAVTLSNYIRRKIEMAVERPAISKLFTMENMREEPILLDIWSSAKSDALRHAKLLQSWMDAGLIRQQDPLLLLVHIWSICEYYSMNERQLMQFLGDTEWNSGLTERLVREATNFVLTACGIQKGATADRNA